MQQIPKGAEKAFERFFGNTQETLALSYLQGHLGRGWTDSLEAPSCVQVLVGDFCFLRGDAASQGAAELASHIPADFPSSTFLIAPPDKEWSALIEEAFPDACELTSRYAIKKEPDCFDKAKLAALAETLPPGYTLRQIDTELYARALEQNFSHDLCSQFSSAEHFAQKGLGFCAMYGGDIVGGASSYTYYDGGIEIEVDTQREHRRKGLATACAARLILECLSRGLYPSWDAANKASVALAQKLGYHFSHEYDTYIVDCEKAIPRMWRAGHLDEMYKKKDTLSIRIAFQEKCSVNPYGWQNWVFDQLSIQPNARILELGCGTGQLWQGRAHRLPGGCAVILADFSPLMVSKVKERLGDNPVFSFQEADIQSLPYPDECFDVVIANHMLYHVPDLNKGLREAYRVLKPGGAFYATTLGQDSLKELHDLYRAFEGKAEFVFMNKISFTLENGAALLGKHFGAVEKREYPDALEVPDPSDLIAYIRSYNHIPEDVSAEFEALVGRCFENGGVFHISKEQGIFICQRT